MTRKPIKSLTLLVSVSVLSVIVSAAGAKATTIDFNYTGSIIPYTVPVSGVYQISTYGAEGGINAGISGPTAGLGAEANGEFTLTAGETLDILVGGQGANGSGLDGGGGGGGSFVALAGVPFLPPGCSSPHGSVCAEIPDTLLAAAGGGGGAGTLWSGVGGQSGTSGANGNITGGGGGGDQGSAGGGGSYLDNALLFSPTDELLAGGVRGGNGEVILTYESAAVPEPASLLLFGTGLLGLAAFARRRNARSL